MSILWTIIIGFVAGVIANSFILATSMSPLGSSGRPCSGLLELLQQHISARQSGGIKLARARVSLEQSLAQS